MRKPQVEHLWNYITLTAVPPEGAIVYHLIPIMFLLMNRIRASALMLLYWKLVQLLYHTFRPWQNTWQHTGEKIPQKTEDSLHKMWNTQCEGAGAKRRSVTLLSDLRTFRLHWPQKRDSHMLVGVTGRQGHARPRVATSNNLSTVPWHVLSCLQLSIHVPGERRKTRKTFLASPPLSTPPMFCYFVKTICTLFSLEAASLTLFTIPIDEASVQPNNSTLQWTHPLCLLFSGLSAWAAKTDRPWSRLLGEMLVVMPATYEPRRRTIDPQSTASIALAKIQDIQNRPQAGSRLRFLHSGSMLNELGRRGHVETLSPSKQFKNNEGVNCGCKKNQIYLLLLWLLVSTLILFAAPTGTLKGCLSVLDR